MKVLLFRHNNPFADSSAASNRYRTLMEGLAALGVRVQLIITEGFQSKKEQVQYAKAGCIAGIEYEYIFPILISNYWIKRVNSYILNPLLLPYKTFLIKRVVKRQSSGTIVWPSFSLEQLKALRKKRPGLIYFAESNEFPDIHKYQKVGLIQRWFVGRNEAWFENHTYHQLNGMALMTQALLKYYADLPPPSPKLLHLPMTVDLDRFARNQEPLVEFENPYIVFVGAMNNDKDGVDILIEAFARIADLYPDYKLYLIGPWHYDTPGHLKLIKDLGLEKRVFWKGIYERDLIPAILKNAKLLVLPRPDSRQAQGGFPTKLGEYLATQNPVCATTVGELPDYLVDGVSVFFAKPGHIDSFAQAMHRALSNHKHAKTVGENGRKVAEVHFNKETQAGILYQFLQSLSERDN